MTKRLNEPRTITNAALIDALQKLPPDAIVLIETYGHPVRVISARAETVGEEEVVMLGLDIGGT